VTLYLGNLKYNTTAEDLRALLEDCGPVGRVCIAEDRHGMPGIAFADMADADAERAIKAFDGMAWRGRRLDVRAALQQTRKRPSPVEVQR
jgi:RNA recognition motif-containing protein